MAIEKYPGWRYKDGEQARIVNSPEEDKALGKGWSETPGAPKPEDTPAVVDKAVEKIRKEAEKATREAEAAARKIGEKPPAAAEPPTTRSATSSPSDATTAAQDTAIAEAQDAATKMVNEVKSKARAETEGRRASDAKKATKKAARSKPIPPRKK